MSVGVVVLSSMVAVARGRIVASMMACRVIVSSSVELPTCSPRGINTISYIFQHCVVSIIVPVLTLCAESASNRGSGRCDERTVSRRPEAIGHQASVLLMLIML